MEDTFTLEVELHGAPMEFQGRVVPSGYDHKIVMDLNGTAVTFEPDEERSYRATVSPAEISSHKLDTAILKAIAERLDSILST